MGNLNAVLAAVLLGVSLVISALILRDGLIRGGANARSHVSVPIPNKLQVNVSPQGNPFRFQEMK